MVIFESLWSIFPRLRQRCIYTYKLRGSTSDAQGLIVLFVGPCDALLKDSNTSQRDKAHRTKWNWVSSPLLRPSIALLPYSLIVQVYYSLSSLVWNQLWAVEPFEFWKLCLWFWAHSICSDFWAQTTPYHAAQPVSTRWLGNDYTTRKTELAWFTIPLHCWSISSNRIDWCWRSLSADDDVLRQTWG